MGLAQGREKGRLAATQSWEPGKPSSRQVTSQGSLARHFKRVLIHQNSLRKKIGFAFCCDFKRKGRRRKHILPLAREQPTGDWRAIKCFQPKPTQAHISPNYISREDDGGMERG